MMMKSISSLAALTLLTACAVETPAPSQSTANIPALAGSEWGPENQPDVFIAFKADGKTLGSGGCNNFFSNYTYAAAETAGAGALSFGSVGATKKLCPPEIMRGEQALFEALGKTKGVEFSHLSLMLTGKDGTPLMTLQRRDWD